jgi:hypothetical protein
MGSSAFDSGTFTPTQKSIASSTNTSPIGIHIVGHGFTTGDLVYVANHATNIGANGLWTIIVTGSDDFTLTNSIGVGVGGATGTVLVANETTVADIDVSGEFSVVVDTVNLAAGDALGVRVYKKVLTGGTSRILMFAGYQGVQQVFDVIKQSLIIANELEESGALKVTLRQLLGTQKSFDWKVLRIDSLASPPGIQKNTALTNFEFVMFDTAGAAKTGLSSFTKEVSIDGADFTSLSGTVTEKAHGVYKIDTISAAELNGDVVTLRFAASGARDTMVTIKTNQP